MAGRVSGASRSTIRHLGLLILMLIVSCSDRSYIQIVTYLRGPLSFCTAHHMREDRMPPGLKLFVPKGPQQRHLSDSVHFEV